ncbi:MAG: glycosyltransferase family 2 protein [Clostridia bacterium]|nr:glycosyltransferase family 2 protein [Clostridia bacterium]
MKISVIIPVYNTGAYLEACVRSALDPAASYEILLVDDGSTDGVSPALCDRLAAEYPDSVRVIHQENRGLGGARNTGIRAAEGEYLLFLDSDDTLAESAVFRLEKIAAETDADVVSFFLRSVDEKGNGTPISSNFVSPETPFCLSEHPEYLLSIPNACGRLWRRSLFLDNGILFPERVWYEDIRTTTKLFALARRIVTVSDELYFYLQRGGSIMHSSAVDRNGEILSAFEDILSWFRERGLFEQYERELCRLLIEHLYLAASVRVLRCDPKHPLLKEFARYTETAFPDFKKNPYLSTLSAPKRLAFVLLGWRQYRLLRVLFRIKEREV